MAKDRIRDWLLETSEILTNSTLGIIASCPKPVENVGLDSKLTYMYIQTLMHVLLATALDDYKKHKIVDKQKQMDHILEQFHVMKSELQNAISTGFEDAWAQCFNQHVDYYVAIEQIPAAMNKEPC